MGDKTNRKTFTWKLFVAHVVTPGYRIQRPVVSVGLSALTAIMREQETGERVVMVAKRQLPWVVRSIIKTTCGCLGIM